MDIRVYRISTCHWCDKVESFLKSHDITFQSILVDLMVGNAQEKAIAESYHCSKQRSFPVTYIDGTCVIGFHESRLRHILKLSSQKEEREEIKSEVAESNAYLSPESRDRSKTLEKMREWLVREAQSHGYTINPDQKVIDAILWGLAVNEKRYGYKVCPCRLATGKYQLDCDIICPCSYCFLDVEKNGRCYCSLFVSDRFISGDPSLPHYVPDSRERSEASEKTPGIVEEETSEVRGATPMCLYKVHIKVLGFVLEVTDKDKAKEGFLKIVKSFDQDASAVQWRENAAYVNVTASDAEVIITMKQYADVYTYQIACEAIDDKMIDGEKFFRKVDISEHKNKLFECYIIVPDSADTKEDVPQFLPEKKYMSTVYNEYKIVAGFEIEGASKDTFIITKTPGDYMLENMVKDIVALEINYYLLSVEKQRYILAVEKLDLLESTIVAKMGIIGLNLPKSLPETLKAWLHGLSNNFSEISGIAEESRHRMNYTILKRDVIRRILKDWGENNRRFDYPVISRFFLERVDSLGEEYNQLFIRIGGIRREMTDLIAMLRTKIDLIMQEQSLELQRSVDETTKTQMMMQHTVEGLSMIVLSYYIIHLAGFIFEALEISHVVNISLSTAKAVFVPIAIALSWFLTFRARRLMKRYNKHK